MIIKLSCNSHTWKPEIHEQGGGVTHFSSFQSIIQIQMLIPGIKWGLFLQDLNSWSHDLKGSRTVDKLQRKALMKTDFSKLDSLWDLTALEHTYIVYYLIVRRVSFKTFTMGQPVWDRDVETSRVSSWRRGVRAKHLHQKNRPSLNNCQHSSASHWRCVRACAYDGNSQRREGW